MPEAVLETPVQTESLGWRAGLPDTLKTNEAFVPFKTVGEFAQKHLEVSAKAAELEKKMGDYVPKLPDNASDEDRNLYYDALGRPKQPSEYEFDGEDKNAPEWTSQWKQTFHKHGLTKTQAKSLSQEWNGAIQKMVEAHNAKLQTEMQTAETKLRSEMGDKYEPNVELAKRMTQKHLGSEFDSTFANLPSEARFGVVRLLLKVASLTGEDRSPVAQQSIGSKPQAFVNYDKSPAPPKKG
jgi:hypothetical protein